MFRTTIAVLPNLTLNLGLRYEYGTPIYEKYNRLSNYDLATGTLINATNPASATSRW